MKQTFEVTERHTLSHFHGLNDPSIPAKFTKGEHRDVNCARLAQNLRNRKNGNSDPLDYKVFLVFLNENDNCIGVKSIVPTAESGFKGRNLRLILSLCTMSKASRVLFLTADYDNDWHQNEITAQQYKEYLKLIECELVEIRHFHKNGEVTIQDGNEK